MRRDRGVALLFALLTLAALLLATLALVRSVDTSTQLLGNIGFKQDAIATADQATRQAINWLTLNSATLNSDIPAGGYYASTKELASDGVTVQPPVDVTGQQLPGGTANPNNRQLVDWDGNGCQSAVNGTYNGCTLLPASGGTINGNSTSYVVFRQCSKAGDYILDSTISCTRPIGGSADGDASKSPDDYNKRRLPGGSGPPYYRVVVRVLGARNTVSFTETIVHF